MRRDFSGIALVVEEAVSRALNELKECQCISKGKDNVEFCHDIDRFFRDVVETKWEHEKLVNWANGLGRELKGVRSTDQPVCFRLVVASACVTTREFQVEDSDAKYTKMLDKTTYDEKNLLFRISSLESSLKAEEDCVEKAPEMEMYSSIDRGGMMP